MVEYVIVFIALLAVLGALSYFISAARRSSRRISTLVSSEYP